MTTDVKPRQLYKQIPSTQLGYQDTPGTSFASNGWEVIQTGAVVYFVYRTYIDLTGWSKQELTTFIQGVDIQKQALPIASGTGGALGLNEHDIISTRRLTDGECELALNGPGFMGSTMDLMQVIYGELTQLADNNQIAGTYIKINQETWGSGVPCATDKIHWTRIYYAHIPVGGDIFNIHPTNLVVQAVSAKEKDLVWIERLRRSFVLQDEADV